MSAISDFVDLRSPLLCRQLSEISNRGVRGGLINNNPVGDFSKKNLMTCTQSNLPLSVYLVQIIYTLLLWKYLHFIIIDFWLIFSFNKFGLIVIK